MIPNQGNEGLEEIVEDFDSQVNDYMVPAIAQELDLPSPSLDLSEQPSTEFTFEIDESLSTE